MTDIKISAQPDASGVWCKFTIDRPVHGNRVSFTAQDKTKALEVAPLAAKLLDIENLSKVVIDGSVVTVFQGGQLKEWGPAAKQVGATIRAQIQSGEPAVDPSYVPQVNEDDQIREKVQALLDVEINPAVASHGGIIELLDVKDGNVIIKMGGGCQGCGAADVTLKQGIEKTIKEKVPEVVGVLDSTDHASGANPYYQPGKM
jgi:Fe-S cluster biogenesis protein NfuA